MSDIVVSISVNSAEALANIKAFVDKSSAEMQLLRKPNAENAQSWLQMFGQIGKNRMAIMEFGHVARASMDGLMAGISPVRMALMEMPRVLQAFATSGIKVSLGGILTELVQFVPLIGAAALAWGALHAELSRPLPMEEFLAKQNDQIKFQVKLLTDLTTLKKANLLTDAQFNRFAMNPASMGTLSSLMEKGLVVPGKNGPEVSEMAKAQAEVNNVLAELNQTSDEGGKKIQELQEKYDGLKLRIQQGALVLLNNNKIGLQQYDELIQKVQDFGDAQVDQLVRNLNFENQQKNAAAAEAAAEKGRLEFAKMAAKERADLEKQIKEDAEVYTGDRMDLIQKEFQQRSDLATRLLYSGEVGEADYTAIVKEASFQRIVAIQNEMRERGRIEDELRKIAAAEQRQKFETVLSDPHASQTDKLNAMSGEEDAAKKALEENDAQLKVVKTEQERLELLRERLTLENSYTSVIRRQQAEEEQINQARIQGVRTMFSNMGAAAKEFGATGLAVYKGFAIAQATMDTAQAAIAAYKSVVGIPYVGPILAPIAAAAAVAAGAAQIANIESASARESGGPVTAGKPYIVGERRAELFVPNSSGYIYPSLPQLPAAGNGGSQAQDQDAPQVHMHIVESVEAAYRRARKDPDMEHWVVDVVTRNLYRIPRR